MNKCSYLLLFILALAVAYAAPQTPSQNQPTQGTAQSNNTGRAGSATPSNGVVSGSAAVNTGKVPATDNSQSSAASGISDSELQSQIQQALNKEPTLAGDTVNVAVSGRSIDLSGSVGNAKQKLTATRIVESYAENRKVVNHLTIGTTNSNAAAPPQGETGNDATPPGRPDLSSHPEPEKGSSPGTSTRPPQ